jgi:hypothetical protein
MTIQRYIWHSGGTALCISLAPLLFLTCLPLTTIDPVEPFGVTRTGSDMAISPYGPIEIRFSSPVLYPDSVRFAFKPLFTEYRQTFNETNDTVTIECILPLLGDREYFLWLASSVESEDGSLLQPGEDTLLVRTFPIEQEPNDSRLTADTLRSVIFGSVSAANDTDWFAIHDTTAASLYLKSTGSSSHFMLCDADTLSARLETFAAAETLDIPDTFHKPVHIAVFAFNRSNGGHYELGIVRE